MVSLQKMFYAFNLVFLYDYPVVQLLFFAVLFSLSLYLQVRVHPHKSKVGHTIEFVSTAMVMAQLLLCYLLIMLNNRISSTNQETV